MGGFSRKGSAFIFFASIMSSNFTWPILPSKLYVPNAACGKTPLPKYIRDPASSLYARSQMGMGLLSCSCLRYLDSVTSSILSVYSFIDISVHRSFSFISHPLILNILSILILPKSHESFSQPISDQIMNFLLETSNSSVTLATSRSILFRISLCITGKIHRLFPVQILQTSSLPFSCTIACFRLLGRRYVFHRAIIRLFCGYSPWVGVPRLLCRQILIAYIHLSCLQNLIRIQYTFQYIAEF